jgi:hypothetical protein
MPQRLRDILRGRVPDDECDAPCPAPPRRVTGIWGDPTRRSDLEAALAQIRAVRNPLWRRLLREKAEHDHLSPRTIRRAVFLLSSGTVRLWVLHDCVTPGCAVPLRDEPQTPHSAPVVRLRIVRPPERAAG